MPGECKNCGNELAQVCMQCHACMGCTNPDVQHDRITALEEAVKVLADVIVENRKQREYERINKLCPGGCVSARLEQAAVRVLNNEIAAEAVRKAGG